MSSTVLKVNFEPVSDILPVHRRDFGLADPTLLDPLNAVALVDGEWVTINSSYKILRCCDIAAANDMADATNILVPYWMERGRYDAQAFKKGVVLWMGDWEADTRIYDTTETLGLGGGETINFVGQPVKIATITIGTRNYSGLIGSGFIGDKTDLDPIVGYVTRLPADNGGKLRIKSGYRR